MHNDWHFLNHIYNFCFYLGLTPIRSDNFNKCITNHRRYFLISTQIFLTCGSLFQLCNRNKKIIEISLQEVIPLANILSIITETIIFNVILTTSSVTWLIKKWQKIFRFVINENFQMYFAQDIKERSFHFLFQYGLLTFILIVTEIIDSCDTIPLCGEICYVISRINQFYQLFYTLLFVHLMRIFKNRYYRLIICLTRLVHQRDQRDDTILYEKIKCITIIYRKMNDCVSKLNDIFGAFHFLLIFYISLKCVYWISVLLNEQEQEKMVLNLFTNYYVVSTFLFFSRCLYYFIFFSV